MINRVLGKATLSGMQIEVTNRCNYHCVMCPFHGRDVSAKRRPIGSMSVAEYIHAVEQFKKLGGQFVIPQGAGESFLHPDILHILELTKRVFRLGVGLNTNGSVLDETMMQALLNLRLDEFGFSIDANSDAIFKTITGASDFQSLEEKIREFVRRRDKMRLKKPLIRVLLVDQVENHDEIPEFIQKWSCIVDETIIQSERIGEGRVLKQGRHEPRRACNHLFDTIFVEWTGDIVICCEDWASETVQGNVFNTPMADIWNSSRMNDFRSNQRQSRFNVPAICASCEAWSGGIASSEFENGLAVKSSELTRTYYKKRGT